MKRQRLVEPIVGGCWPFEHAREGHTIRPDGIGADSRFYSAHCSSRMRLSHVLGNDGPMGEHEEAEVLKQAHNYASEGPQALRHRGFTPVFICGTWFEAGQQAKFEGADVFDAMSGWCSLRCGWPSYLTPDESPAWGRRRQPYPCPSVYTPERIGELKLSDAFWLTIF